MFRNRIRLLGLLLLLAACGGDATTTTSAATTTAVVTSTTTTATPDQNFPATVTVADGEVVIPERPEAIVSLSATATEMLFAIGAGEQVVAVDSLSNYPPEAPVTDLAAFTPSAEAVASYSPDLVVISFDTNDLLAGLTQLDIPTLLMPAAATSRMFGRNSEFSARPPGTSMRQQRWLLPLRPISPRSSPAPIWAARLSHLLRTQRHLLQRYVLDFHRIVDWSARASKHRRSRRCGWGRLRVSPADRGVHHRR